MSETLIVFTRYPEPGKTKTRMIPALGAEGAAKLQQQMTEHTINTVRQLLATRNVDVQVHYTGGDRELMTQWLGEDLQYLPQVAGDLGVKMRSALKQALETGTQRAVVIGIDCPDLDRIILSNAFEALKKRDLVLGSAQDGGYYLIGLSRLLPQLFDDIPWGTDRVLERTTKIARELKVNYDCLPTLADVDRPEDLVIWQKYGKKLSMNNEQ